jgi:hypothetical protein
MRRCGHFRFALYLAHAIGGVQDRLHNILIARATANDPFKPFPDFFFRGVWILLQQSDSGHHHPGGAVPALQAVTFPKALLNGVKLRDVAEAFYSGHLTAFRLDGEDRTGLHGIPVQQDGAGAALAGVTPDVCARESERIPQEMDEQCSRLDLPRDGLTIHRDGDWGSLFVQPMHLLAYIETLPTLQRGVQCNRFRIRRSNKPLPA